MAQIVNAGIKAVCDRQRASVRLLESTGGDAPPPRHSHSRPSHNVNSGASGSVGRACFRAGIEIVAQGGHGGSAMAAAAT